MKDIFKTGLILLIISFVAAMSLALTNEVTKDKIIEQRMMANELAKKEVLPEATRFEDITGEMAIEITENFAPIVESYVGYDSSNAIVGYVFKSRPTGFGGPMEVVTGINLNSEVTGLRVGSHQETPGLGAKGTDVAYYEQYAGKSAAEMIGVSKTAASGNDIQAITGATITSDAITVGANASIDAFHMIIEQGGVGN